MNRTTKDGSPHHGTYGMHGGGTILRADGACRVARAPDHQIAFFCRVFRACRGCHRILSGVGRWEVGWLLPVLMVLAMGPAAMAHKSSDSYLRVLVADERLTGEWHLALHDLEFAIGLDGDENGEITWGELKSRKQAVLDYARSRLDFEWDGRPLETAMEPEIQVEHLANGGYVVLRFGAEGSGVRGGGALRVGNRVFFDSNPLHRGLMVLEHGPAVHQAIFNPRETQLRFDLEGPEPGRAFLGFLKEGVHHIWLGYDHVLFLLVLLLPAVLRRENGRWVVEDGFRGALWNVVRIVTAFTVAHSITLTLAALGWVRLPSRLVETVIAASILAAALNNLRPVVTTGSWMIAFGFGLVHGFGFASVLADLGLPRANLVQALVGFNVGVELGQLAIVLVFLPLAYGVRRWTGYPTWVLSGGSGLAALVALRWVWERLSGG